MKGFDFFNGYNDKTIHSMLRDQESLIIQHQKNIFSTGDGMARYFQHHEQQDICFIAAFLAGSTLDDDLGKLAFSFVRIKGYYDTKKDSYAVFNTVEDSNMFFNVMKKLGSKYQQNNILMVPKKGTGLPFLYYFKDGSVKEADRDTPEILDEMVGEYFSQLNGKKFRYPFTWSQVNLDLSGLVPLRSGMACMVTVGMRESIHGYKFSINNAVKPAV